MSKLGRFFPERIVAGGFIDGVGAGAANALRGCTVAFTGAGDYLLTLERAIDLTDEAIIVTPRDATLAFNSVVNTSDTQKQILTYDGAAGALDHGLDFAIFKIRCVDGKEVVAAGSFGGAAAGAAAAYGEKGGAMTRTGVGDYNITLDRGLDTTECVVLVTSLTTGERSVRIVHTSDTVKQVLLQTNLGAAVDSDVSWVVLSQLGAGMGALQFAGSIIGDGTGVAGRGGVLARTGAGVYTLNLDKQIDSAQCICLGTPREAAQRGLRIAQTSDLVKTINTQVIAAGAATNSGFSVAVLAL